MNQQTAHQQALMEIQRLEHQRLGYQHQQALAQAALEAHLNRKSLQASEENQPQHQPSNQNSK